MAFKNMHRPTMAKPSQDFPPDQSGHGPIFAAGIATCDLGDVCEGCAGETCDACAEQAQFEVMDRMRREGL